MVSCRISHSRSLHVASPDRLQYLQFYYHLHTNRRRCFQESDTPVSHTEGPFSGPALTIMSFNVEVISAAKEQLIADLRRRLHCAVVCMQENHRGPDGIRPSIPGMDLAIERPQSQYGSAICVTSGTIVNTTSLTDINNIEILRVDLNGISATPVYKPPGERFSFHQPLTVVGDQHQVIIGDFNSHSSTWGYATTNTDGELVDDWAENQRLSLIHDPKLGSSFNSGRWRRGYNPDIIFATNRIAGCCNKIVMEPVPRTLPTSTHWSASECSYHRVNRTFPATIRPEEGKLEAVRTLARCSRGEHTRHSRML